MQSLPPLVTFLLLMVSGWVSRHQQETIEYLQAENQLLKEKFGGRRIRFTDADRALLARKTDYVQKKADIASAFFCALLIFTCRL